MNVAEAMAIARSPMGLQTAVRRGFAAEVLAAEVDRLRAELLKANAEQERLENQLDSVRGELVAANVQLDEWERVQVVAADIAKMLADNDIIPPRDTTDVS